jgi:hypothetical protein
MSTTKQKKPTQYNNKHDPSLLNNLTPLADKNTKTDLNKTKWAKFTYVGKETKLITKVFKCRLKNIKHYR